MYILATAASVCFGRRMAPDDSGLGAAGRGSLPGIVNPPRALGTEDAERLRRAGGLGQSPGTTVLVFIVLVASITYYFVNWALLSFVREVGQGPGRGRPAANARALFRTAALVPIGRAVGVSHRRECGHGGPAGGPVPGPRACTVK